MRVDRFIVAAFLLAGFALVTRPAAAQGVGVYGGWDFESERGVLGANLHFPLTIGSVPKTTISPQFEILTTTDILVINAGASIRFHPWFKADSKISPYFGPGLLLGYNDFTGDTEVAGQAIAGLEFPLSKLAPFVHWEFAFGGFDITAIVAGIQFNF